MSPGTSLYDTPTPALLLDAARLERNIASMQKAANAAGVEVRPHVKTHKSTGIARMQLNAGAVGLTAATVHEAFVMLETGTTAITVAYPLIDPRTIGKLMHAALERHVELVCIFDSDTGLSALESAARGFGGGLQVMMKIDVGLHRCGLREDDPHLPVLARRAAGSNVVRFTGLLSHAGNAYGAAGPEEIREIAAREGEILRRVRDGLRMEDPAISVGSTPTLLTAGPIGPATEIRPGNYVFRDRTQIGLGASDPDDVALSVLTTIVSMNHDYYIVDAGSKTLSSDLGAHGGTGLRGYGTAVRAGGGDEEALTVERLSEEHGFVRRGGNSLAIGERLRIVPNHACVVANLGERYIVMDGESAVDRLPIDARGGRHG